MYFFCKNLVMIVMKIAFKLCYEGTENIPQDENYIFASNHRSNADPPVVAAGIKGKCSFMAKEELFKNKLFGWLIRNLGAFPVARGKGDTSVIDTAVERLQRGDNLMIFPEGTRSKDGKVHRGHTGAALIAARTGKDIIPVGIIFGEKLKFRCKVTIKYGKPIRVSDYCNNSSEPNPRALVKLKNKYMSEITRLVEGEICKKTTVKSEVKADE